MTLDPDAVKKAALAYSDMTGLPYSGEAMKVAIKTYLDALVTSGRAKHGIGASQDEIWIAGEGDTDFGEPVQFPCLIIRLDGDA